MNNYVNTEKSLKRWLKSRVKITMATVVGFLIAGTVSFAMEAIPEKADITIKAGQVSKEQGKYQITIGKETKEEVQTSFYGTKSAYEKLLGTSLKGDEEKGWIVNKNIVIDGSEVKKGQIAPSVISAGDDSAKKMINKGNIWVKAGNGYVEAMGTQGAEATIINEGNIYVVDGSNTKVKGMGVNPGGTAINRGLIVVNNGSGMIDNSGSTTKTMLNDTNGKIIVEGSGAGIYYRKEAITNGSVENKGTIEVTGKGTGVLIANDGNNDDPYNGKSFTNSGTIIANNGEKAIYSSSKNFTLNLEKGSHIEGKIVLSKTGTDTINITGVIGKNGTAEELQSITDADKITVKEGSNIKISAGSMKRAFTNSGDSFIAVENSNLENHMDLTETGENFSKTSSLIQVYGKDGKVSKVINHGNLTVANGSQVIYTNASNGSTIEIENYGELTNNSEGWASVINGKIDGNNSKIYVANNGTITTNKYGTGIDITVGKGITGTTGEIVNNGTIVAAEGATYATGIQVEGASSEIKVVNSATGKIEVGTGAGIYLNNSEAVAENEGTIVVTDKDGKAITGIEGTSAVNNGVVKATYDTSKMTEEEIKESLFGENTTNNGIILDETGEVVEAVGDEWSTELTTTALNGMGKTIKVSEGNTGILTGNMDNPAKDKQFNLAGGVMKVTGNSAIENSNFAVTGKGYIDIEKGTLGLADVTINGTEAEKVLNVGEILKLDRNNKVAGNITGAGNIDIISGKTVFDGKFGASALNIGVAKSQSEGYFTADSEFTAETTVDATNGVLTIAVAEDKSNVLANSKSSVTVKGNVGFDYSTLTKDTTLALGNTNVNHNLADAKAINEKDSVYKVTIDDTTDTAKFEYNKELLADFGNELNAVNKGFQVINDKVSQVAKTTEERAALADKIYSSNSYSETVRAAYDNVKMNEEAVESLARKSEVGKWTAEGKALYSKNEYDRKGIVKDYSSEVESTGLMAAFGYGVSETTTAGVAFSGVKQDVDTDNGSADADLFYLGVYGNKVVGNYDFTAGLGYQFGEYDADNNILGTTGDKYDTQALSGYVQGRYTADLGDGLSVQPKVKLGYTYIDQDNAKDSYFGVSDAEISTFDAEVGFDVVKSVQFEKSQADVKFGLSYTKAMGDTDKEFTGRFYGTEVSNGFDVLGAELAENTVKFDLGAEVTNENGFFYNGGFTYKFGSNDTEAYGVNVGVGYKF